MKPRTCERNGCTHTATQIVRHTRYLDATVTLACNLHAAWWVRGINHEKVGSISPYWGAT